MADKLMKNFLYSIFFLLFVLSCSNGNNKDVGSSKYHEVTQESIDSINRASDIRTSSDIIQHTSANQADSIWGVFKSGDNYLVIFYQQNIPYIDWGNMSHGVFFSIITHKLNTCKYKEWDAFEFFEGNARYVFYMCSEKTLKQGTILAERKAFDEYYKLEFDIPK